MKMAGIYIFTIQSQSSTPPLQYEITPGETSRCSD